MLERAQGTPQPGDALGKPVFGRRKTPAYKAFALGAERRPGRELSQTLDAFRGALRALKAAGSL